MTALPYRREDLSDIQLDLLREQLDDLGYYPGRDQDLADIDKEMRRRLLKSAGGGPSPYVSDGY